MPALLCDNDHPILHESGILLDHQVDVFQNLTLDRLASEIVFGELLGNLCSIILVLGEQQLDRGFGRTQASDRIDTRTDREGYMSCGNPFPRKTGVLRDGGNTDTVSVVDIFQSVLHQRAVLADQRHQIGNSA